MIMLSDPNTVLNSLSGNPTDNQTFFSNQAVGSGSESASRGAGQFSLMYPTAGTDGTGVTFKYGVMDEGGKLNVNALIRLDPTGETLYAALMLLPNMTADVADAIVDWLDADDDPRTNGPGAESDYYMSLTPPYQAKNGPINSLDELLLVRGVTAQLLYGNDRNRNGRIDPGEEDGNDPNLGWSAFLTCYGREVNADSDGNARVYLADTDLATNYQALTEALGQDLADYVMAYRLFGGTSTATTTATASTNGSGGMTVTVSTGSSNATSTASADQLNAAVNAALSSGTAQAKGKISSVLSLVNTSVSFKPSGGAANAPNVTFVSPLNTADGMQQYLPMLLDKTTTIQGGEVVPRINVNTAPQEVLMALPGVTDTDIQNALSIRDSLDLTSLEARTGAWLVTQAGMNPTVFQALEQYITGTSHVFRVQSIGYFSLSGPVARVEAVIDTTPNMPRILYFRDMTDLGRGFDPPR
jgi:type II secretory pathway component PulK